MVETKDLLLGMSTCECPIIIYNTILFYESIYINPTNTDFIEWIIDSYHLGLRYSQDPSSRRIVTDPLGIEDTSPSWMIMDSQG